LRLYQAQAGQAPQAWPVLFESRNKWLHPLFELQEFLSSHAAGDRADLFLHDRIIGLAAAHLILRMGLRHVKTDLASRPAVQLLQAHDVAIEALQCVNAISCITETLLKGKTDPDAIYPMLAERRAKALARLQSPF